MSWVRIYSNPEMSRFCYKKMAGLLYCLPLTSTWLQTANSEDQSKLNACLTKISHNDSPLVLYGDEKCGKTVLLFQAAVGYASQDFHVTYISMQPLTQMPLPVHGMTRPEAAGLLKTLTFMYTNKAENLVEYCASIHTKPLVPDVIIIDDLDNYLGQLKDPGLEPACAKFCAILKDTFTFIKSKSTLGVMMLSCRDKNNHTDHIFKQFNFTVAHLKVDSVAEKTYSLAVKGKKASLGLNYAIKEAGLFVKDVSASCLQT